MTQHVSSTKSDNEVQCDLQTIILMWINQQTNKSKFFSKKASTMVLDSGATSHFVRPDKNLPVTDVSKKAVALANGSKINATHTTDLPFDALTNDAWKAHVLPGLRPNSLVSVGKLADAGYTTIIHPAGRGVTVHQKKSMHIRLLHKPVLQGWQDENGLWRLSCKPTAPILVSKTAKQEAASNVYSLPSILQAIKYLHAAAGFPTKDTWVKAIKNGNYVSWPGLTVDA